MGSKRWASQVADRGLPSLTSSSLSASLLPISTPSERSASLVASLKDSGGTQHPPLFHPQACRRFGESLLRLREDQKDVHKLLA